MGKGGGADASSIKLNLADPCYTLLIQYRASTTAGGLGHLLQYMRECNAKSPKQDSKSFNSHGRRNTLPIWV